MYEQVEKPKENKSRAVANSVTQKKHDVKQGFGFVDNRPERVAQRKLQRMTTDALGSHVTQKALLKTNVVQRISHEEVELDFIPDGKTEIGNLYDLTNGQTEGVVRNWLNIEENYDYVIDNRLGLGLQKLKNDFLAGLTRLDVDGLLEKAKGDYDSEIQNDRFINGDVVINDDWTILHFTVEGFAEENDTHDGSIYIHAQLRRRPPDQNGEIKNYYLQVNGNGEIGEVAQNRAGQNLNNNNQTWRVNQLPAEVRIFVKKRVRSIAHEEPI